MKILILSDGVYPFTTGGMQKHTSEITRSFLEFGVEVKLVFCVGNHQDIPSENEVLKRLEIRDTVLFSFKALKFPAARRYPGHYIRESYLCSRNIYESVKHELENFDFIYVQGFAGWFLVKNKKGKLPPVGINFHGLNMFQKNFGFRAVMEAFVFRFFVKRNLAAADYVFSFGGRLKSIYSRMGVDHKLIFHPIGINADEIVSEPVKSGEKIRFIFIGRYDKVKGLDVLQAAVSEIPEHKYQFLFVGDIPAAAQLKRSDCSYTGLLGRDGVNQALSRSDVLICPSYSEGMPFVILEAMSGGLVVLASDVGAVSELVDENNGFLMKPGDTGSLLKTISRLEECSREKIMEMKYNSVLKAKKFTWSSITQNVLNEISKRTGGKKGK